MLATAVERLGLGKEVEEGVARVEEVESTTRSPGLQHCQTRRSGKLAAGVEGSVGR